VTCSLAPAEIYSPAPEESLLAEFPVWAHARMLARQGIPVFPVRPDKTPATAHGHLDASLDEVQLRDWFGVGDDLGLAIPTGPVSGVDVLDVDDVVAFGAWCAEVRHNVVGLHAGSMVATPSGGLHFWWRATGARNGHRHIPGCDWRGDGGYVVVPPTPGYSYVAGGGAIRLPPKAVMPRSGPGAAAGAPVVPSGGIGAHDAYLRRALDGELHELAETEEGARNKALHRAAWNLARFDWTGRWPQVAKALATTAAQIGLGDREVAKTIDSAVAARVRLGADPA